MSTMKRRVTRLEQAMADLGVAQARAEQTRAQAAKDTDRSIAEGRRQWGELANKMGTLVEDIVAPSIPELFQKRFGLGRLEYSAQRVRRAHRATPGRLREFDYVAMADGLVLVNETKSRLRPEDIPAFLEALSEIRDYLPEADGRTVVGSLASFSVDPSLVAAGERLGLLMLGLGTGLLQVLNSPGFEPRRF